MVFQNIETDSTSLRRHVRMPHWRSKVKREGVGVRVGDGVEVV